MGFMDKLRDLVRAEEDYDEFEEEAYSEPRRTHVAPPVRSRTTYGLTGTEAMPPRREQIREPLALERERDNLIQLRPTESVKKDTTKLKIVVSEPKAFDECPQLVDSLKAKKPVIINLESIENGTARKVFDFLSGATYALNGNVQKIAQNIFVFLPENVDIQNVEPQYYRRGDERADRWR